MKMNKLITITALALASAALMGGTAKATTVASEGDLLLSFRSTAASGTDGDDLEIDLTSANFTLGTPNQTIIASGSALSTELTTLYGSGSTVANGGTGATGASYNTNADLVWSVVGTGSTGSDLYLSDPGAASQITGLTTPELNTYAADTNDVTSLYSEGAGAEVGSTNGYTVAVNSGDFDSYSNVIHSVSTNYVTDDYGFATFDTEAGVSSTGSTDLELYELTPTTGHGSVPASYVDDGTFVLYSNGSLIYDPTSPTPEPSTYALLGLGALVLVVMRRRMIKA